MRHLFLKKTLYGFLVGEKYMRCMLGGTLVAGLSLEINIVPAVPSENPPAPMSAISVGSSTQITTTQGTKRIFTATHGAGKASLFFN